MDYLYCELDDELCDWADELDDLKRHGDILGESLEWLDSEEDLL